MSICPVIEGKSDASCDKFDTFTTKSNFELHQCIVTSTLLHLMHQELKHFSRNMDSPGGRGMIFPLKVWVWGLGMRPEPLYTGL